jgi:hypothetical protein
MNHITAVKELREAIRNRAAKIQELNVAGGTPQEHEARFFEAEVIRDEVKQLEAAIDILEGEE